MRFSCALVMSSTMEGLRPHKTVGACALTMVAVAALVSSAAWYVQLVLVGGLGVAVYVPVLLVVGLTDGEKVAMRNGLAKVRGRS